MTLTPEQKVVLAKQADLLLKNEAFTKALGYIESEIFVAWQNSENPEQRDSLWHDLRAITKLRDRLSDVLVSGQYEAGQLEKLERKS